MKRISCLFFSCCLLCVLLIGCIGGKADKSVIISSKLFTENILLSEMYAQLIESRTDIRVNRRQALGGTAICYTAMENEEIDIYVEYTGTVYNELLKLEYNPNLTSEEIYSIVEAELRDKKNIYIYPPLGLNNTYVLAMQREKADAMKLKTMSDLGNAAPKLVFGANALFYARANDGYESMIEKYGMNFKSSAKIDTQLLYDAVDEGHVDVMSVYATDALLKKYDMAILEDDKKMFPAYQAIPMIRSGVLEAYPELDAVLRLLTGLIDNERMQELNYLVDIGNQELPEVAKAFLTEKRLLG